MRTSLCQEAALTSFSCLVYAPWTSCKAHTLLLELSSRACQLRESSACQDRACPMCLGIRSSEQTEVKGAVVIWYCAKVLLRGCMAQIWAQSVHDAVVWLSRRALVGSQAMTERHSGAERVCVGRDEKPTNEFCIRGVCLAGSTPLSSFPSMLPALCRSYRGLWLPGVVGFEVGRFCGT